LALGYPCCGNFLIYHETIASDLKKFCYMNMTIPLRTYLAVCTLSLCIVQSAYAYVASSSNYLIQEDSINVGGVLSTTTGYNLEDTLGESAVGTSSSATYRLKAGYQQMQETYLAITSPGNIALAPNIPSVGGGVANGQASWTVTTDNPAGYMLSLVSSGAPALSSGIDNFSDYTPAGSDPDFIFSVGASASEFGYSPEGVDIVQTFKDNGAACNLGASDTADRCWAPLSTTPRIIGHRVTANNTTGSVTTIKFRAESGASHVQPAGAYTATATLMLMAL
jgi:hypothetical protein